MGEYNQSEFVPIGLIAKDAAEREHPPEPGENDLRQELRNNFRKSTEQNFLGRMSTYLRQGKLKAIDPFNGAPYDPELPELDADDPMWSLNPHEQNKALELLGQLVRHDELGRGTAVSSLKRDTPDEIQGQH